MIAEYEDRWVTASGLRTRYWEVGEGPPLILLHGIGAHAGFWRASIPGLANDYRVIVPDLCGSGRSDVPGEVSRAVFSDWLADFIDAVGASPASLVANSMGGGVALATSLDHREHVHALVLVSALGLGKSVGLGFRIASIPVLGELVLPSDAKGIRRELLRIAYDDGWFWDGLAEETEELAQIQEARQFFFKTLRWGVSLFGGVRARASAVDELSSLNIPVQIIWGRQDPIFPLRLGESAVRRIPGADLVVIDDCGHMPHMERPDEFNRHVRQFLISAVERPVARPGSD
jgi:4,5:9,10-diseco-3-hydroxy-5,9,17-trioxoandrosta-1(10),2-diene-4-oate hydrolase